MADTNSTVHQTAATRLQSLLFDATDLVAFIAAVQSLLNGGQCDQDAAANASAMVRRAASLAEGLRDGIDEVALCDPTGKEQHHG